MNTKPECAHCNFTGSLSRTHDGYQDCPHCSAVLERAKLAQVLDGLGIDKCERSPEVAIWMAYVIGRRHQAIFD